MSTSFATLKNGTSAPLATIPQLPITELRDRVVEAVNAGARIESLFGDDGPEGLELFVVLADDAAHSFRVARARLEGDEYPAFTPDCTSAHLFERELAEQYGVRPVGHPWLKPVRFHSTWREGHDAWDRPAGVRPEPGVVPFFRVEGEEIHEVAVGPVHAGVIEPGHFRFQCHGEHVFHLEIALGYQHRDLERALVGGPHRLSPHQLETAAGDTTIAHAWAHAAVLEALTGTTAPPRALALRAIALELERLANHTGDLGALSGDVAFLPTMAWCGRIRGDFLNATAVICGSRLGRGLVRAGGVRFDADPDRVRDLHVRLGAAGRDATSAIELLFDRPSVLARFEHTGVVSTADALAIGLVGPAARASGLARDARIDHPLVPAEWPTIPIASYEAGDVFSRASVRWDEMKRSLAYLEAMLDTIPAGPVKSAPGAIAPDSLAVSLVEGWRGGVCHVAITNADARLRRYKVVDPSFHNWFGLALALRDAQISDFPLCNKSFNLSYCGHDL